MATLLKRSFSSEDRKQSINEKFADPKFIIDAMADYLKDGDIASITDLIAAYIKHSNNYKNQEEFADKIGTTRQTLHRLFSNNKNVSLQIFFSAIEQIYSDAKSNE